MPSITAKKIKGPNYYYARKLQRVKGKPKIVWQQYLGIAEDLFVAKRLCPNRPPSTNLEGPEKLYRMLQLERYRNS